MNQEHAAGTAPIAEAIGAAHAMSYIPVTFESCDQIDGPLFHGTKTSFAAGERVSPGQPSNYHEGVSRRWT